MEILFFHKIQNPDRQFFDFSFPIFTKKKLNLFYSVNFNWLKNLKNLDKFMVSYDKNKNLNDLKLF